MYLIPVYEFQCAKCKCITEKFLPITSEENIPCDKCGCITEKIISNTGFILKGSGWACSGYCKNK